MLYIMLLGSILILLHQANASTDSKTHDQMRTQCDEYPMQFKLVDGDGKEYDEDGEEYCPVGFSIASRVECAQYIDQVKPLFGAKDVARLQHGWAQRGSFYFYDQTLENNSVLRHTLCISNITCPQFVLEQKVQVMVLDSRTQQANLTADQQGLMYHLEFKFSNQAIDWTLTPQECTNVVKHNNASAVEKSRIESMGEFNISSSRNWFYTKSLFDSPQDVVDTLVELCGHVVTVSGELKSPIVLPSLTPNSSELNSPIVLPSLTPNSTPSGKQPYNNRDTIVIASSILLGVGFCVAVAIIIVVLWQRHVKKFREEFYDSEAGGIPAIELQGFGQPANWWAGVRIPDGIREIPITDLQEVRPLGAGGFAMVYEVKLNNDAIQNYEDLHDKQLAVKIVYKEYIQLKDQVEAIMREINVMKDLDNQYVVQLIGASLQIRPSIVMELVPEGSLENLLYSDGFKSNQTSLQWKLKLILNISKGIQYLHSKGITHRDLKPQNILIKDKHEATIKISDFGLSKITKAGSSITRACVGTVQYMAPEVCEGCQKITKKVDIWALGVIMQEIIRGVKPWNAQNQQYIYNRLTQHKEPPNDGELPSIGYPEELCQLIRSCWRDASRRPLADEVVNIIDGILHQEDTSTSNCESKQSKP